MAGWTRRDTLKSSAAAAAVACTRGTGGGETAAPVVGQIDTIIFVMMENRSFDHYLGARTLEEGDTNLDGLTADMVNLDPDGNAVSPYLCDDPCQADPPHGWSDSHDQWNEGANDGFCKEYATRTGGDGAAVMAYQNRSTIPITWALADNFTVCDRWFCSVMGPTWPNRIYGHAGSNGGITSNELPGGQLYDLENVWSKVEEAGVEWAYYYSDVPFIAVLKGGWDKERVQLIDEFFEDAAAGRLPPVVWVDPGFSYNDNHPPHHPALGELFLATIYEALAASPQWERILLVITYDEHGGFFDHVSPPKTEDDYAELGFDQLGFRVPAILVGPWVKQGVDHTVYDHTSWLRYVCDKHGIEPWTSRIAAAASVEAALDADRMASNDPLPAPSLPAFEFDEAAVGPECQYDTLVPAHISALAETAREHDLPVRLTRADIAAPFLAAAHRAGLIG